jgi:hypothetical protein
LPGAYFRLLESGATEVEQRLDAEPNADLKTLEGEPRWRHFPQAILAPAVLYAKRHAQNSRYHDPKMLALALRIGDLLASENEKGRYEPRLDSDWDTAGAAGAARSLRSAARTGDRVHGYGAMILGALHFFSNTKAPET